MRRRAFMAMLSGALWPLATRAQERPRQRIGLLTWEGCPTKDSVFGLALRDLGYTWQETVQVLCRSAEGNYGRLPEAAAALVRDGVDVIAALTHVTAFAAHDATKAIPIVMIASGDPVKTGLVVSLARPGGNVTGLTYYSVELVEKRLQLLKEIVPHTQRVAVLGNSQSDHVFGVYRADAERAARALGLELVSSDVNQPNDIERSFAAFAGQADGLLVLTDPMLNAQAQTIVDLAARHRLPAIYWGPSFIAAGGLAAYSADFNSMIRTAARYVDKILRGASPSDLPIEQPTRFSFIINLKTAKALGLVISPIVLARADEVIE